MTDYYDVLGLSRQAESDAIAKAFRRYAMAYHPQCHASADSVTQASLRHKFRLVCQAYTVLSSPTMRAVYDLYGEEGVRHGAACTQQYKYAQCDSDSHACHRVGTTTAAGGGVDVDAIDADAVFRGFFGVESPFQMVAGVDGVRGNQHDFFSDVARQPRALPKTPVLEVALAMTLEDVYYGATRRVTWRCAHTHAVSNNNNNNSNNSSNNSHVTYTDESAEVHIAPGADNDDYFVLPARGHTAPGCARGDVVVRLRLQPHARFRREGDDLVAVVPITLSEALCGTTVTVHTMDGRALAVLIDEIVHRHYRNRIAGEGLPRKARHHAAASSSSSSYDDNNNDNDNGVVDDNDGHTSLRGDLVIECATNFPGFLTLEQKSELRRILDAK